MRMGSDFFIIIIVFLGRVKSLHRQDEGREMGCAEQRPVYYFIILCCVPEPPPRPELGGQAGGSGGAGRHPLLVYDSAMQITGAGGESGREKKSECVQGAVCLSVALSPSIHP